MPKDKRTVAAVNDYIRQLKAWRVGAPKIMVGQIAKAHNIARSTLHRALNKGLK